MGQQTEIGMTIRKLCPHCGAQTAVRSRRRLIERLLFFLKAFRCEGCNRRFYSRTSEG
jgi:transposase-like protein